MERTRVAPYPLQSSYTGTYSFKLKDKVVPARFSFLYGKIDGEWLIKEHHSSAMPEKVEVSLFFTYTALRKCYQRGFWGFVL